MTRRTPREKKNLEYTKDHVPFAETIHGFRRMWPRKKARANKAYRRKVHNLLANLPIRQEEDFSDNTNPESIRREPIRKWYIVEPLGVVIPRRIARRLDQTANRFFKHDYDRTRDHERFAAFLTAQVGGRTENSLRLALHLQELLDPAQREIYEHGWYWWEKKHEWLRAFFQDEPEWEERVRTWISSFEEQ